MQSHCFQPESATWIPAFYSLMSSTIKKQLLPTIEAFRSYWPAILIIQLFALGIVISYYWLDETAGFYATISEIRTQGGLTFAALSTVISGGILPEPLKRFFRPKGSSPPSTFEWIHQLLMWVGLGILVERFYHLQGILFGHQNDAMTLLSKILVDQLIFTPLVSLPFIVSWFLLHESRYSIPHWIRSHSLGKMIERVLPLWLSCLIFWPVMLLIIYSLPSELQFPLFLFGNAAYSILMIFILRRQSQECEEDTGIVLRQREATDG